MATEILSLDNYKTLYDITDTSQDAKIILIKTMVEDWTLAYTNQSIASASQMPGLQLPVAQAVNYQMQQPIKVKQESIGNYSVQFLTDYPDYIYTSLNRYRICYFISDYDVNYGYYRIFGTTMLEGTGLIIDNNNADIQTA